MSVFLYKFFHNKTNDRIEEGKTPIPDDMNEWPDSWKTVEYKYYNLFSPILLEKTDGIVWDITKNRRISGQRVNKNNITLEIISYLLRCGYGLQSIDEISGRKENRAVPSAGQRYPLELYVVFFKQVGECCGGVYHYNISSHALEPMFKEHVPETLRNILTDQPSVSDAHGVICISAVFDRTVRKYGSRGYRYILLEAGHVAQNMLLAATEKEIALIPIGGSSEKVLEQLIGLNSRYEGAIYSLFF